MAKGSAVIQQDQNHGQNHACQGPDTCLTPNPFFALFHQQPCQSDQKQRHRIEIGIKSPGLFGIVEVQKIEQMQARTAMNHLVLGLPSLGINADLFIGSNQDFDRELVGIKDIVGFVSGLYPKALKEGLGLGFAEIFSIGQRLNLYIFPPHLKIRIPVFHVVHSQTGNGINQGDAEKKITQIAVQ